MVIVPAPWGQGAAMMEAGIFTESEKGVKRVMTREKEYEREREKEVKRYSREDDMGA